MFYLYLSLIRWVFEKYDGIRAFWNPEQRRFYSRHGKEIVVPEDVLAKMPRDTFLDGEIWFGRDNFQQASKLANRSEFGNIAWSEFRYMVFDAPKRKSTYEERYLFLGISFPPPGLKIGN